MQRLATRTIAFTLACIAASLAGATTLDLTSAQTNVPFAGALFTSGTNAANVGTGVFGTFVQIENKDVEEGYNTTVNNTLDNKGSNNFNHEIDYFDISIVNIAGVDYRQFNLDINEPKDGKRYLSLDDLELYLSPIANQSTTNVSSLGTRIYDLDLGGNNNILLDYSFNNGSGLGVDLAFLVPNSLFTAPNQFVYLYSKFGGEGNTGNVNDTRQFIAQAGFEEWASAPCVSTRSAPCVPPVGQLTVPEPGSLLLIAIGLTGIAAASRGRKML